MLCAAGAARGQEVKNAIQTNLLKQVAFEQNLDAQLPLDTPLRDESGKAVTLGDYFGKKKPVVLLFVYFECPMLCKIELNGFVRNIRTLSMTAGNEYEIVTVSIDPRETPSLASKKKANYLKWYDRPGAENGWHFLTGEEPAIRRLTGVAGFKYAYDEKNDQYAHPAGLIVATPGGKISRYIYGVDFPASALRWAMVEASAGKVGSPVDKLLLMCFHYDPATGRYNFAIMRTLQVLGSMTALALGGYMGLMHLRERRRASSGPPPGLHPDPLGAG
ncbi:MAG: SCO family protein [Isosphaeraceae bacterium]